MFNLELRHSYNTLQTELGLLSAKHTEQRSQEVVLATVADHHLRSGSGSNPNKCLVGSAGCS